MTHSSARDPRRSWRDQDRPATSRTTTSHQVATTSRGHHQTTRHQTTRHQDHQPGDHQVTHQIVTPPASGAELVHPDDHQGDDRDDTGYPWWLRLLARFRFAYSAPPSLLDRFEYALMQRSAAARHTNTAFVFATLPFLAIGRFVKWTYFERLSRCGVAVVLTPFVIAVLNALPVTNWVVPDGWDWIGHLFHPTLTDPTATDLPIDAE